MHFLTTTAWRLVLELTKVGRLDSELWKDAFVLCPYDFDSEDISYTSESECKNSLILPEASAVHSRYFGKCEEEETNICTNIEQIWIK